MLLVPCFPHIVYYISNSALANCLTCSLSFPSPHISPVCLPASGADYTGQVCTITGWGKDGWGSEGEFQAILKETRVPVMDSEICQQVLRGTKLGPSYNLHQGMICAGGEEDKDACKVSIYI